MSDNTQMVALVAGREINTRLRTKSFLISTIIMIVVIVGLSVAMKLTGGGSDTKVGLQDAALAQPLTAVAKSLGEEIETTAVTDVAAGEQQVRDGDLDALVLSGPLRVVVKKQPDEDLKNALNVLAQQQVLNEQISKSGGDPAAVNQALAQAAVKVTSLEPVQDFREQRIVVGIVAAFLLFIGLQGAGVSVAQGVVEEKSSRIVEILLTSIKPWQLMLGKVAGIGATGLLQLGSVAAAGVVAALATGSLDLPASEVIGVALWAIVWFLVGFVIYALLYAACGALVSRQEEVAGVTAPLMVLMMIPYLLAFSLMTGDPDSTAATYLPLVPFFAPILMPMRVAFDAPLWQPLVALGLSLLTIVVLVWLAGRVYSNSVLRTGSKVGYREALRKA